MKLFTENLGFPALRRVTQQQNARCSCTLYRDAGYCVRFWIHVTTEELGLSARRTNIGLYTVYTTLDVSCCTRVGW